MSSSKPLALIIEDDPTSAEALAFILRDWGADVLHAATDRAVDAMAPRFAELRWIITDFHLGAGPNGVTLVQRLATLAPQARILVLSGSFHGRASAEAADAGFDVMQKPARAVTFVGWLERG
jgi:DNA-binding response OmpR family regulator